MQSLHINELPPEMQAELEGKNFVILTAGRFPKVIDSDTDSIALGVRHKNIDPMRDGFDSATGQPTRIAKSAAELSAEIGNVDHHECQMFRIDRG